MTAADFPQHANRRDANEAEIVKYFREMGCRWIPMRPGQGFDGLLIDGPGKRIYLVEVKNPATKWHLTDAEQELSDYLEAYGMQLRVIESVGQAKNFLE